MNNMNVSDSSPKVNSTNLDIALIFAKYIFGFIFYTIFTEISPYLQIFVVFY